MSIQKFRYPVQNKIQLKKTASIYVLWSDFWKKIFLKLVRVATFCLRLKEVLVESFRERKENPRSKIEPAFFKCLELISSGIGELHEFLWSQNRNRDFIDLVVAYGLLEITTEWMKCVQSLNQHRNGTKYKLLHFRIPSNRKLPEKKKFPIRRNTL